ncbi:MAG: penicillin-binding protein 2 [Candidatus Woesebacteria bacterium]
MSRLSLLRLVFSAWFLIVLGRLYYWQGIKAYDLRDVARRQYERQTTSSSERGIVYSADGYPLVLNTKVFTLVGKPNLLKTAPTFIASSIASKLPSVNSSASAILNLAQKLSDPSKKWVPLLTGLSEKEKDTLATINDPALTFEENTQRYYPEGSMSAHLLGFVGKDNDGNPQGYFGIEGKYDLELKGRPIKSVQETDAVGHPIGWSGTVDQENGDGRDVTLTLRRDIQFLAQEWLKEGVEKYGAKSGDVLIMDPMTGKILAMASYPGYDPSQYSKVDQALLKNPSVADGYEPGSTFKVLTVASGIDAGVITPDTQCDKCNGPVTIGKYTIKTWNNEYHASTTIQEGLTHSDNTAMVFVGRKLGQDKFLEYIEKFGIGTKTGIDLQDESTPKLRPKKEWGEIDTATATFGQGIALTPIQMLNSVNVIANGGTLYKPYVVEKVASDDEEFLTKPQEIRRVISEQTAKTVAQMMQTAASQGDAHWTLPKEYPIAGKTGTAQIPVAGHYDSARTIASFVGFAPMENPKFSMLVRLVEPSTSQWGSETAAPLWFSIAKDLFVKYGISPTKK